MVCRQMVEIATIYQAANPKVQVRLCRPCTDKLEGRVVEIPIVYRPRVPDTPWAAAALRQLQATDKAS